MKQKHLSVGLALSSAVSQFACQSVTQPVQAPLVQHKVPLKTELNSVDLGRPDFGILGFYDDWVCPSTYFSSLNACYNAGGNPLVSLSPGTGAPATRQPAGSCTMKRCCKPSNNYCQEADDGGGGSSIVTSIQAVIPEPVSDYPELNKAVFSPRGGAYPSLFFEVKATGSDVDWVSEITGGSMDPDTPILIEGAGEGGFTFSGYVADICLIDGMYQVKLAKATEQQEDTFYIDNTPPVIIDTQLTETVISEDPLAYRSEIHFTVKEPIIREAYSGVIQEKIAVFVDESLYSFPVASILDDFWLTALVPEAQTQMERLDDQTVKVTLTLPYRFTGHTLEVAVEDFVGNKGHYLINPELQTSPGENS